MRLTAAEIARARRRRSRRRRPRARSSTSWGFDSRALAPGACFVALRGRPRRPRLRRAPRSAPARTSRSSIATVSRTRCRLRRATLVRVADALAGAAGRRAVGARSDRAELRVVGVDRARPARRRRRTCSRPRCRAGAAVREPGVVQQRVRPPDHAAATRPRAARVVVTEMGERFPGDIAELCDIARPESASSPTSGSRTPSTSAAARASPRCSPSCSRRSPSRRRGARTPTTSGRPGSRRGTPAPVVTVGLRVRRRRTGSRDVDVGRTLHPVVLARRQPLHGRRSAARTRCRTRRMAAVVAHRGFGVALDEAAPRARGGTRVAVAHGARSRPPTASPCSTTRTTRIPTSMEAALRALAHLDVDGRRIAVLGDMRELGAHSDDAHRRGRARWPPRSASTSWSASARAARRSPARPRARRDVARGRRRREAAATLRRALVRPGDAVLVKASRAPARTSPRARRGRRELPAEAIARDRHAHGGGARRSSSRSSARRSSSAGSASAASASRSATTARSSTRTSPRPGTPTMGGIAIVGRGRRRLPRRARPPRERRVRDARAGRCSRLIVGLGVVGFVDDYLGVRARRNLGLRKRGKTLGIVARRAACSRGSRSTSVHIVDASVVHAAARLRPRRRSAGSCWAVLVVYATANAVNLTDGLDGLAAGSSAFVFAAFMIIAFTEFRHPDDLRRASPAQALDLAIVAAAMFGACAGFLWWNAAPAQIFMGDTGSLAIGGAMAGLALLDAHAPAAADPRRAAAGRDAVGDRAGHLVPRLPPAGAAHGADPPPLRGRRLVGVHGDRAVLAVRRDLRRARRRHLLRRLPPASGGSNDARALVIGLAETGDAVARRLRGRGLGRRPSSRTRPAATRYRDARRRGARARRDARRGADDADWYAPRSARSISSCRARSSRHRHPALVARRARPACRCAARSTSRPNARRPPIVAVTGTNGKTTVTTLTAAMLAGVGPARGRGRATSAGR